MRNFWKREQDDLEGRLRARRSEAPETFVRSLAHRVGGTTLKFRPQARYVLVGAIVVAFFAASASAGGWGEAAKEVQKFAQVVTQQSTKSDSSDNRSSDSNRGDKNDDKGDKATATTRATRAAAVATATTTIRRPTTSTSTTAAA